ncbi:hypothetical protein VPH35_042722 [Triticum aestivum]|uniref:DUF4378 domain-containing protein n=1 Tax=Triticum turgidum subsp. durum TaxID=4567 RepID=A0A9R0RAI2_TRITD|nr:uncharacterized protein LOC123060148 isoform X1 [Triticum aestivum]XP_044338656.1 uncharacterized protein LOC123060148 isoform X1 [Triticum aestivum]VAH56854.1 unnamed protein product [Triticum turgidum subsp. durum]
MLPGPGQMAQLLHPQDSGFYGRKEMGGRWSFLELFGLRRRLRSTKKMISDKKHGSRLRGCYVPFKDEDSGVTDEQRAVIDEYKNTKVKNKHKGSKKSSGKSGLKSLFSRKLYGKEDQKEKMLPVGPKLLRTLSIHYLENNDYVLNGQSAANGDSSSHDAKLSLPNDTSTNLQQDTLSNLDGSGTDHVKRKSHRSISMDGILHKVPYGQRLSGDNIRQELPRSASATYDRDGLKPCIGTAAKRHGNSGFRRSRSLSESLESYSHLLDSISSSESKRLLTSSKSTRDHSLDGLGAATALQRTSISQLRSKSVVRLAEFLVIPEDTLAPEVPEEIVGDVKLAVDEGSCNEVAGGSEDPVSLEELLSECDVVESSTEDNLCIAPLASEVVDVSEEQAPLASSEMVDVSEEAATYDDDLEVLSSTQAKLCTDPSASEVDIPEEHATTCNDDDLIHSSTGADPCTLLSLLLSADVDIAEQQVPPSDDQIRSCITQPSEDIDIAEELATISEDNQIHSFDSLKSVKGTSCVPDPNRDTEDELNLCCEQETESPTSVLDVAFSDHPAASSENQTMLNDSSLVEKTVHSNEAHDHSVGTDDDLDSSTSVKPPTSSSTEENILLQENNLTDLNALQEAADDPKNEAELAYVNDIFNKSSFRDEALFEAWRSQNRAALQEDDCQHYDAAAAAIDFTDMSADELLLFDLTNEALLEVYKDYAAGESRQPRFSSFQRPKPVGDRALRELRSRVGRQLDERPQSGVEVDVDAVLSSDLGKAERWSNFRREADQVASLVANSVLDRLVTELALQLAKF